MSSFKHPTFIVLDLPEDISKKVMDIRVSHEDKFRSSLPVEITVVGSTGVGVISEGQEEKNVFEIVEKISKNTKPLKLSFSQVKRIPDTDIFVLKLKDEKEIRALHEKFINSEIKFDKIPPKYESPFDPHCTLRSRSPISEEDVERIQNINLEDEFVVDTLSVYMLDKLPIKKLFTVKLGKNI